MPEIVTTAPASTWGDAFKNLFNTAVDTAAVVAIQKADTKQANTLAEQQANAAQQQQTTAAQQQLAAQQAAAANQWKSIALIGGIVLVGAVVVTLALKKR